MSTVVETQAQDAPTGTAAPALRWGRPVAVALPLIVLNCGWIANSEMRNGGAEMTISTLFMDVTFLLFVVTLLNLAVRRRAGPRAALSQPELMVLYALLSMSSVVAGIGNFGFFLPILTNPFYYGTPQNGWPAFLPLLPSYIGPRDPAVLKPFYDGHSTAFQMAVLRAWAWPLAAWSGFFLVLLWTTLCLAVVLRRRWADEEHLPFPVVALPLEMTREGAPLYRQPLLWLGFAFPAALHSLNTLQGLYPTLPSFKINSQHDLVPDAALAYPWTAVDALYYQLHPVGLGFGYLINTDVSFSLWFFFLLKKALNVAGVVVGWRDPAHGWAGDTAAQFPFTAFQGYGAWLALALGALWAGRGTFRGYLRRAFRGDPQGVDAGEPMSARLAVFGFLAGFLALCAFVWASGGSWWLPPAFLGIYLLIMVTLSRIRAETAVLSTELAWINPQSILPALTGTSGLSRVDVVHMGILAGFNTDYRAAGMPHELEGLVGLERARARRLRPLVWLMLLAAAVALVSALLWDLQLYYVNGAATAKVDQWRVFWKGNEPWTDVAGWLHNPKPPDGTAMTGMAAGIAVTFVLSALRARFLGFPLVPAAYALNTSFANDFFWGGMFAAWLVKSLILRYGGMALYRRALPLFLGLILGDFVTGSAWSIFGAVFHLSLFRTFAT